MINLQNKIFQIDNPIEIDYAVEQLRVLLLNLDFLTHGYHIAQRFVRKTGNQKFIYPETYIKTINGKHEYHRLTADNDYKGMFFFYVDDEKINNPTNDINGWLKYDVSIIFSVNLKLIDETKLTNYRFTQTLIRKIRETLLKNQPNYDFRYTLNNVETDLKQVYREFELDDLEQYNRLPMQCFRLNMTIEIEEICENIDFIPMCKQITEVCNWYEKEI